MLPLVSSMTTQENGSGSFWNSVERHRLGVVEDLEVGLREIRHQALVGVGDGDVERHDLRARLERGLLREQGGRGRDGGRGRRQTNEC